ncbi:hypothetical protein Nizo1838_2692 [Lactiplantibacillus plantarum]|nr:hypothetical protein Nizo1838_2692 [Lactiplantibacillus plantarum]KZT87110.1 hypothetical protein Nizo2256_2378 [Lactiplantibacillus plantarum]
MVVTHQFHYPPLINNRFLFFNLGGNKVKRCQIVWIPARQQGSSYSDLRGRVTIAGT